MQVTLAELVADYDAHGRRGQDLVTAMRRHVIHVAKGYPETYFDGGRRDEDSLDTLVYLVFTSCACTARGREPFLARTPFRTYREEDFPDPPIRYHSFYAQLSVTREVLRDQYARTVRADPELQRCDRIYRSLGKILAAHAERVERGRLSALWRLRSKGPAQVRDAYAIRTRLAGSSEPLDVLVVRVLELAGQPLSRSQIAHIIADIRATSDEVVDRVQQDLVSAVAVRAAVRAAWSDLDRADRSLLAGLARGHSSEELIAAHPDLRSAVHLTRALKRVGDNFVRRVVETSDRKAALSVKPRELVEAVVEVLLLMLPELESDDAA